MSASGNIPITIESYQAHHDADCKTLYLEGLIGGKIAENDTGLDIDDIPSAYMKSPDNHFWVAVNNEGHVLGMIGVQKGDDEDIGEIRRLRVCQDCRRRGIGSALMEKALQFCKERQFLKITLDTFMEREPAIKLFEKFHFNHTRTRKVGNKELLYFYLDLYSSDRVKRE